MLSKPWLVFAGGILCATLTSAADDTLDNDGAWSAHIDGDSRTARRARVVIYEFGGHWQELGPRRAGDRCRTAKPFPITVQKSNLVGIEFTVWAASVSIGCPDFALTLHAVDERTLAGTTSDGRQIRLTREPAKRKPQR